MIDGISDRPPWWRKIVGTPSLWQGSVYIGLGLVWVVLGLSELLHPWRFGLAGMWLVLGVGLLLVALSDHRHKRGRFSIPPPDDDEDL
jgi:hypothetical protein